MNYAFKGKLAALKLHQSVTIAAPGGKEYTGTVTQINHDAVIVADKSLPGGHPVFAFEAKEEPLAKK